MFHVRASPLAAGLYTFKTSVRHTVFLDLCYANNLTVMAAFSVGSAQKTSLGSLRDLAVVKARLKLQIRASIHPGAPAGLATPDRRAASCTRHASARCSASRCAAASADGR